VSQVPALRELLQEAAERRYGRSRWRVRLHRAVAPTLAIAASGAVLISVSVMASGAGSDGLERAAAPKPAYTARITRLPSSLSAMRVLGAKVLGGPEAQAAMADAGVSGKLETAWEVPGLSGHIFLLRRGDDWCLSAPDPYGGAPADRGVTCATDRAYDRHGVSLRVGNTFAAALPQGLPSPTLRLPDGAQRELDPSANGLVVIARVADGVAVLIRSSEGTVQTNRLRITPVNRYECADGRVLTPEIVVGDPCEPTPTDLRLRPSPPLRLDGRGG
jgi:hypothetical protein